MKISDVSMFSLSIFRLDKVLLSFDFYFFFYFFFLLSIIFHVLALFVSIKIRGV